MYLDFELLETFIAIVDGGGFTRAGERVHKTQSTVSQQLKRLEERVGARLLSRSTRGVALTEQGELLLGYARRLVELHERAVGALDATRMEGVVRMGAAQDVADGGLAILLAHFTRLYPGVRLEVRVDANCHLRERIGSGELDLAIVLREPGAGGEAIKRLERVWVAAPEFERMPREAVPLALFEAPCIFRNAALDALDRAGIPWRIALTTPSLAGLRAAVRSGLGVSVRTSAWLESDLRILGEADGFPPLPEVELALLTREVRVPAAAQLLSSVKEAFKS